MPMQSAYIIDGIRTPICSFGGALSDVRTDDLAVHVLRELVRRNESVDFSQVGDVIMGCANQAGEDNRNVARMALLLAGLPVSIPGETVNRLCASGLSAAMHGARMIMTGDADLVLAGGVEHMTRGPWVISKTSRPYGRDARMYDSSFGWRFVHPDMKKRFGTDAMGETAENLVERDHITRKDQDRFALASQQKAAAAKENGRLAEEIIPVTVTRRKAPDLVVAHDEFIRPDTTMEVLAALRPAFRNDGSVTAGNSSGLNDGAACLLIASEQAVIKYRLAPMARIMASGVAGVEPRVMGIGPVEASRRALERAGRTMGEMDIIELNEAFAAQSLACIRAWGLEDDDPRINPNGGAIALGHPLGMSGTRILHTAALELKKQNKKYALVTMCVGVGQGFAVVIENVNGPATDKR